MDSSSDEESPSKNSIPHPVSNQGCSLLRGSLQGPSWSGKGRAVLGGSCLSKGGRRQGLDSYPCTDGPQWGHPGPVGTAVGETGRRQGAEGGREKKRDEQTGSRIHVTAFANGRTVLSTIFSSEGERHRKKKKKNPDCAIPKATWKTSTF